MYEYKEKYTIDFTNVKNYLEIHFIIRKALDFPDYYGCNWQAFWDCLTDMVGRSVYIEIFGLDVLERKFPTAATNMLELIKDFKHYSDDEYVNDIQIEIVHGESHTILDWFGVCLAAALVAYEDEALAEYLSSRADVLRTLLEESIPARVKSVTRK